MELVGFLGNLIRDLLQLLIEFAYCSCSDALFEQALSLGVWCMSWRYFGACTACWYWFLGRVTDLRLRIKLFLCLTALPLLLYCCVLSFNFDWLFKFLVSFTIGLLLSLVGFVWLYAIRFAILLVLPTVLLFPFYFLLWVIIPLSSVVFARSFLSAAIDFLLPVEIYELIITDGWSEYLLDFDLEYSITELLLLQLQQLLDLFLKLVLLYAYLLIIKPFS